MEIYRNNTEIMLTYAEMAAVWEAVEQRKALELAKDALALVLKDYSTRTQKYHQVPGFLKAIQDPDSPVYLLERIAATYRADRDRGDAINWGNIILNELPWAYIEYVEPEEEEDEDEDQFADCDSKCLGCERAYGSRIPYPQTHTVHVTVKRKCF